jgi:hypothetical protein
MFKVLKVDGPNIVTDKGCIALVGFSYADGGKTHPVSHEDWLKMRDAFLAIPALLAACELFIKADTDWESDESDSATFGEFIDGLHVPEAIRNAVAKAKGGA